MGVLKLRTARRNGAEAGIRLSQRRAWFDGEGTTAATETGTTAGSTVGNNTRGTQSATAEAKFTQADLDRIAGETRKSAKQAAINDLLKELGIEKPDELKALVTDAKTRAENEKTEAQKALDAKADLEKKLKERETELESFKAAQLLKDRDSSIKDALRAAGVTDSEKAPNVNRVLVLLQAERTAEVDALLGEDGSIDKAKLTKLVDAAKADYPDYFKAQRGGIGSPSTQGGRTPDPGKDAKERARQEVAQRQRSGW